VLKSGIEYPISYERACIISWKMKMSYRDILLSAAIVMSYAERLFCSEVVQRAMLLPGQVPQKGSVEIPREHESAEFIDLSDANAVRQWAQEMCKGLKLDEIAQELDIEPTVEAVTRRLTSDLPEPAEAIARKTCEAELRRANPMSS
jgi:hypothetical protein